MNNSLAVNEWISVLNSWRINSITHSICIKFIYYHVRPAGWEVALAEASGQNKNETQIIKPKQVSLICGLEPGFFKLITLTSNHLDKNKRTLAKDYDVYRNLGQAKYWYCDTTNFFNGNYEVFNGPNSINLFDN